MPRQQQQQQQQPAQELAPYDPGEHDRNLAVVERRVGTVMAEARRYLEPIGIDEQFFMQATLTALGNDSHLMNADPDSLKMALLKCAQRGLMPDGESAVLVAYKRNVTLIPMVGGMLDIVRRNVPGIGVDASVVRRWDKFRMVKGTSPVLEHEPRPPPADLSADDLGRSETMTRAYCIVTLPPMVRGAEPVQEVHHMWRYEIERIRSRVRNSRTPGSPWTQHAARMYEKTVLRAAFRRLPSRHQIFAALDPGTLDDYTARTVQAAAADRPVAALLPPAPPRALKV